MELYIERKKNQIKALCIYDEIEKTFTIKKGSRVSEKISESKTFRSAKSIEAVRKDNVKDGIVMSDITFLSASTAANFVTGSSTNGLIVWKDEHGTLLKQLLEKEQHNEHD